MNAETTMAPENAVKAAKANILQGINAAIADAMEEDDNVIALGEDLADPEEGGVCGVTRGLSSRFGEHRVRSTPISEQAIIGAAIGASLVGFKPIAEIMLMNFTTVAMDMIVNHAAKLRFMSGGQTHVPIVIRTMTGTGFASGGQHCDYLEAWFAHTAGIKVVAPSSPKDAYGLMRSAIDDPDPVLFIENLPTYWTPAEAPEKGHRVPIGKANVLSEGSDVTIIELLPRLVPVEDQAISAELEKSFRKQGIKSLTGTKVTKAAVAGNVVEIEAQTPDGKTQTLSADILLVAIGRAPVTRGLGVEELGIAMDRGYIKVDELYRTSVPNISAIGDVITLGNGVHPQLAHVSSMEGIVTAERIAGQEVQPINYDHVPGCTYCDPEIGSVGLSEAKAKERGYDVRVGSFPFGVLGRAKMAGETEGFVKIVADKKYDEVLGVHMIGPRSTELVAEAVLALRLECTVEELMKTIHAHPTFAEAIGEAAHATHGAAIHM